MAWPDGQAEAEHVLSDLRHLGQTGPWIMLMLRGGHFAGAVFEDGKRTTCFSPLAVD